MTKLFTLLVVVVVCAAANVAEAGPLRNARRAVGAKARGVCKGGVCALRVALPPYNGER